MTIKQTGGSDSVILNRVLNHFDRDRIYPSPKYASARPQTFEIEGGLYESRQWCIECNREVHRYFAVRTSSSGEQWAVGVTQKGFEWICDQIDKRQADGWPNDSDSNLNEKFVEQMPEDLWDTSFVVTDHVSITAKILNWFK
jgi:hypothetical protein